MTVLEGLKPEKVFYFFEKLCEIPHGSTNMKEISDYLVSFAKERNLKYYQDEAYNVVIYKEASAGYEDAPITILQGHCDMVAEKTLDSNHDFTKDGLKLKVEGDYLTAEGTTLGGDDGIAVAYMLAILDDDTLKHPALECVITTDEEIGLLGAKALDTSVLKGTHMINMDSEEEGYLWISCAGGLSGTSRIPVEYQEMEGVVTEVLIDGLNGGHSGAEIDKNRANANKLMGLFLYELGQKTAYSIKDLSGGTKDNAITRSCKATLVLGEEDLAEAKITAEKLQKDLDDALAKVQQMENEKTLSGKGVRSEDLDYVMFKVSKLVDDKTTFEKAADKFLKENPKFTGNAGSYRISTSSGNSSEGSGGNMNASINDRIRAAARR